MIYADELYFRPSHAFVSTALHGPEYEYDGSGVHAWSISATVYFDTTSSIQQPTHWIWKSIKNFNAKPANARDADNWSVQQSCRAAASTAATATASKPAY